MKRPTPARTVRAAAQIGSHLTTWRKLQNLTAEQVADRAGISRSTLHRLETDGTGVTMATFLDVVRVLGHLDHLVDNLDPYTTDLGRSRADQQLPRRVRNS